MWGPEEKEVTVSPFFAAAGTKVKEGTVEEPMEEKMKTTFVELEKETTEEIMIEENTVVEVREATQEERQVSESPPRASTADIPPLDEDEVILDSPTATRSTFLNISQFNEFSSSTDETTQPTSPQKIIASPGYESPETDLFPPSPPTSGPFIMALPPKSTIPTRITTKTITCFNRTTETATFTPTISSTSKKAFTPRPSHIIFPDTPTPSPATLNPQHSSLVQGLRERYLHSSSTSNLQGSIASRPMTPVHTPLLRHGLKTPGMGNLIKKIGNKAAGTMKVEKVGITQILEAQELEQSKQFDSAEREVEQIEEISPPRGRKFLERFRFSGR